MRRFGLTGLVRDSSEGHAEVIVPTGLGQAGRAPLLGGV